MRASGGDHFAAWGACRWQKRDKRPLTRCRLPAPRSLAIKLRTGRGQTEEKAAASERERGPLFLPLYLALCSRPLARRSPASSTFAQPAPITAGERRCKLKTSKTSQISPSDRFFKLCCSPLHL